MQYGPRPSLPEMMAHAQRTGLGGVVYLWARGGEFNRPVIVECFLGVRSEPMPFQPRGRLFFPEVNYTFPRLAPYPPIVWESELADYGLAALEWAGPVLQPGAASAELQGLCERWRADAETMEVIAAEDGDDEASAEVRECRERSSTLHDCANGLTEVARRLNLL